MSGESERFDEWPEGVDVRATIDPRDKRIAELETALASIVDHHVAMSGPKSHHFGCDCGGTNDGKHSCASLQSAITAAAGLLF